MKQQVKSIIETFIANVPEFYPSIYLKDDVVTLLNDLLVKVDELEDVKEQEQGTYTKEQIANAIDEMRTDTIVDLDYSSAEFELDGNEISVTNVDYEVDTEEIRVQIFKVLDRN